MQDHGEIEFFALILTATWLMEKGAAMAARSTAALVGARPSNRLRGRRTVTLNPPVRGVGFSRARTTGSVGVKAVVNVGLGDEVPGSRRLGFQLAPHLGHVDPQVVGLHLVLRAPYLPEQLAVGEELALVGWRWSYTSDCDEPRDGRSPALSMSIMIVYLGLPRAEKMGGTHLSFDYIEQILTLSESCVEDVLPGTLQPIRDFALQRVL